MTPLTQANRNPLEDMIKRQALMNHPCEFFRGFFGGRVPTLTEKLAWIEHSMQWATPTETWENETYRVCLFRSQPFIHLSISRKDGKVCKEWRDFQEIKNQLVGPRCEAVELFPSEDRLVDTCNQYHLWVVADPNYRFPFGFDARFALAEPIQLDTDGAGGFRTTVANLRPDRTSQGAVAHDSHQESRRAALGQAAA